MRMILILIGVFWIITGVSLFMLTDASKKILRNLFKQKNMRALSIVPIIIGIVLIRGSYLVSMPWIAVPLGILAILKGIFFIFGPEKKTSPLIDWWLGVSNNVYKSWGIAVFLLGILFLLIL